MRIALAASPSLAIPTLNWLHGSEHELVLVITQPDRPAGRGQNLRSSQVALWAAAHNVSCVKPESSDELVERLVDVDLVVTIGYGVILPERILNVPRHGFINLHFSLLPRWRGAAPVQRAILNGDEELGLTVFALDAGMDTGPIYVQRSIPNEPYENSGQCLARMATIGAELVAEAIDLIATGVRPIKQSDSGVSFAPKITKDEARIRWSRKAVELNRQIRAFTPEPGAWTTWRDVSMRINRAHPYSMDHQLRSGEVALHDGNLVVGCGEGSALLIEELTPAGKKIMSAKSWVNGARALPGESFV
ncbi:MAG: methionyl-tRNA formyltransferase [Candidatus Nanopelagicaceae bacterium]|nr:methionyl-tRNA formyltransferase [Candidatus Nanopelagicaceae bacterium]